jgi:hypothetical protein
MADMETATVANQASDHGVMSQTLNSNHFSSLRKNPPKTILQSADWFEHIDGKVNTNNFLLKKSPKKADFGRLGFHDISRQVREIDLKLHFSGLSKQNQLHLFALV